jgi:hypothetical protein
VASRERGNVSRVEPDPRQISADGRRERRSGLEPSGWFDVDENDETADDEDED